MLRAEEGESHSIDGEANDLHSSYDPTYGVYGNLNYNLIEEFFKQEHAFAVFLID